MKQSIYMAMRGLTDAIAVLRQCVDADPDLGLMYREMISELQDMLITIDQVSTAYDNGHTEQEI